VVDPRNPYSPPSSRVADHVDPPAPDVAESFIPYGRRVPAGHGATWIGDAWRLLRAQAGKWIVAMLLIAVVYIVISLIPFSSLFSPFLWPFVAAGIIAACDKQRRTGTFELNTFTEGPGRYAAPLLTIGGMYLLSVLALFVSVAVALGMQFAMKTVLSVGGRPDPSMVFSPAYGMAMLVYLAVVLPLSAATFLAPALITLHGIPALTAMKMSFFASFKNVASGLVFSLCVVGLCLLAVIPLGLGLLVLLPVLALTNYTIYRDLFVETNPR
jgi:hypothetical protein